MGWALDLILLGVIAVNALICFKRGFVRTLIELAGWVGSLFLSFALSSAVAEFVYQKIIRNMLIKTVEKQLSLLASDGVQDAVSGVFDNLPGYLSRSVANYGITKDAVAGQIGDKLSAGAAEAAPVLTDLLAQKIVVSLLTAVFLFVLFAIFMFIVRFLAKLINAAFSVPILGGANKALGAGLGALKGLVVAAVLVCAVNLVLPLSQNGIGFVTPQAAESSLLFPLFAKLTPRVMPF